MFLYGVSIKAARPQSRRTIYRVRMFEDLKQQLLCASDLDLHYACLCVFHEMTTRRLGGNMTLDSSGNAVLLTSPQKPAVKARAKTPKKKQDAIDTMFAGGSASDGSPEPEARIPETRIAIGEEIDLELGEEPYLPTAPPAEEPSPPRAIPAKKPAKTKSRE